MPDDPNTVRRMFDRIVPRYDLINRLMSAGMDRGWRRLAARAVVTPGATALDVGAGSGDLALDMRGAGAGRVIGLDFAAAMLAAARRKDRRRLIDWLQGDALRLPFADATFDCVASAFVLRNLTDLPAGLAEMVRVVRPGGRLASLDLTQPPKGAFGAAYRFYFERVVPELGGLISGDRAAYRYLPSSLEGFPDAGRLARMIEAAGMTDVRVRKLGSGVAALHIASKPA